MLLNGEEATVFWELGDFNFWLCWRQRTS